MANSAGSDGALYDLAQAQSFLEGALTGNLAILAMLGLGALIRASGSASDTRYFGIILGLVLLPTVPLTYGLLTLLAPLTQPATFLLLLPVSAAMLAGGTALILRILEQQFPSLLRHVGGLAVSTVLGTGGMGVCVFTITHASEQAAPWPALGAYLIGAICGMVVVSQAMLSLGQRLAHANAPAVLQGLPLQLLSLGIAAMALSGMAGLA
jgi:Na+-transporting NADH:ubiquinone oxidoreductase subunit NqrE